MESSSERWPRLLESFTSSSVFLTWYHLQFKQKVPVLDKFGKPVLTATDSSNPWWTLLGEAVRKANGKLDKPQINVGTTDARYFRVRGVPAIGFSPIANTPILIHDHNEVRIHSSLSSCFLV